MISQYFPSAYAQSVFSIDYDKLYEMGFRGLIFDVDNTLVHHGDPSTERVDALLGALQQRGFALVLLSDNDAKRLADFTKNSRVPFVPDAEKPDPRGYDRALGVLGVPRDQALVIGDQVFTDICGANGSGLASVLVHFVTAPGQRIGKKRYVEKVILFVWRHSKGGGKRLGLIEKTGRQAD